MQEVVGSTPISSIVPSQLLLSPSTHSASPFPSGALVSHRRVKPHSVSRSIAAGMSHENPPKPSFAFTPIRTFPEEPESLGDVALLDPNDLIRENRSLTAYP